MTTQKKPTEAELAQANQNMQNIYVNAYIQKLKERHDALVSENIDLSVKFELQTQRVEALEKEVEKLNKASLEFETSSVEEKPTRSRAAKKA